MLTRVISFRFPACAFVLVLGVGLIAASELFARGLPNAQGGGPGDQSAEELPGDDTDRTASKDEPQAVLELLLAGLKDPSPPVRRAAAYGLEKSASTQESVLMALLEAADDEDHRVRYSVQGALGRFPDARAAESLAAALRSLPTGSRYRDSRERICDSLQRVGAPALPSLAELSNDDLRDNAYPLARAIAQLSYRVPEAQEIFIDMMGHTQQEVRVAAARVAGSSEWSKFGLHLVELLQDESPAVRSEAAQALGRVGDERAIEPLQGVAKDEDAQVRASVLGALTALLDGDTAARGLRPVPSFPASRFEPVAGQPPGKRDQPSTGQAEQEEANRPQ